MLADTRLIAMVPTTDRDRAKRFYADVLGLRLLGDDGFALIFEVGCATLRVVSVKRFEPFPFTLVGWHVTSVRDVAKALADQGVEPVRYPELDQDNLGVWVAPGGVEVLWFRDPDGNLLSVSSAG